MKTGKGRHITTLSFAFGIFLLGLLTAVAIFASSDKKYSQMRSFRTLNEFAETAGGTIKTQIAGYYSVLESCFTLLSHLQRRYCTLPARRQKSFRVV